MWAVWTVVCTSGPLAAQEPPNAGARTIGQLLAENGIEDVDQLSRDIRELVVAYGPPNSRSDDREFLFAGHVGDRTPDGRLVDSRLHVVLADRLAGTVQHGAIALNDLIALDGIPSLGSVSLIVRTEDYIYISTHLNPSAVNTVVLDRDLDVRDAFYGWPLARLPGQGVVFHNSMIHFMSTHPGRISVYDPVARIEREIYPPEPRDEVRLDFIDRVRAAYEARGEDWFRTANHHMDPEAFDTAILELVVDESSNAIAFHAVYSNPINDGGDPLASRRDVVVICTPIDRVDEIRCIERGVEEWAEALDLEPIPTDELLTQAASRTDLRP